MVNIGDTALKGWPLYDPEAKPYVAWSKPQNLQIALGNFQMTIEIAPGVELRMIKVPAGSFIMGSTRQPDEMPQTAVTIDKPFWIGHLKSRTGNSVLSIRNMTAVTSIATVISSDGVAIR